MKSNVKILGILNVTPDSFSDGGKFIDQEVALQHALQMIQDGADIIDIGGESTRPGAESVSVKTELDRVIPIIRKLRSVSDIPLSIDTNKSQVAKEAVERGATIVNSLGGFQFDSKLAEVVAQNNVQVLIYHIHGVPRTMQKDLEEYPVIEEINTFFQKQIKVGESYGVAKEQFILDPGIGFGKTVAQNLEIIRRLSEFQSFGLPIAIGVSRKSHLGKLLQQELNLNEVPRAEERLEASLAETAIAVQNGATYIRTHDVAQTKRFLTVLEKLL